jgi:DNA (cytosine-5)-methyltransferase 1
MRVLDLFCGAGGLAQGFKDRGHSVIGVDVSDDAGKTFKHNNHGNFQKADLTRDLIRGEFDVIVGGPPCKPWSAVNTVRRGAYHKDFVLLSRFFEHVKANKPRMFLLENVPLLASEPSLKDHVAELESGEYGYSTSKAVIQYSRYGASTKRHRFILFGTKEGKADNFFHILMSFESKPATIKSVIWNLRDKRRNEVKDHVWPELRTIDKYVDKYKTHKFGWYILDWNEAAPSFGNIMKTYILHPDAFNGGPKRVLSVKEAALIMGFDEKFCFPDGLGIGLRYQMVVDSVCPVFSRIAATIIQDMS